MNNDGITLYEAMAALFLAHALGYDLPMAADHSVAEMSDAERTARSIVALPNSLGEAIDRFEASALMREILGDTLVDALVTNKRHEWRQYRAQVTPFEIERYLPSL